MSTEKRCDESSSRDDVVDFVHRRRHHRAATSNPNISALSNSQTCSRVVRTWRLFFRCWHPVLLRRPSAAEHERGADGRGRGAERRGRDARSRARDRDLRRAGRDERTRLGSRLARVFAVRVASRRAFVRRDAGGPRNRRAAPHGVARAELPPALERAVRQLVRPSRLRVGIARGRGPLPIRVRPENENENENERRRAGERAPRGRGRVPARRGPRGRGPRADAERRASVDVARGSTWHDAGHVDRRRDGEPAGADGDAVGVGPETRRDGGARTRR